MESNVVTSALALSAVVVIMQKVQAQNTGSQPMDKTGVMIAEAVGAKTNNQQSSPIYGVTIPTGYRDWKLIAVDNLLVPGKADQLRAQLGNDIAIKAFKEGKVPFPDGAIIAAIHWARVPSENNNTVLAGSFPGAQSFVVGFPVNVQFMVKDSKKYAATAAGDSLTLRTESRATRRCTRPALPATSLPKQATLSSPVTHLSTENPDN
jgi:hypothetical protein